MADKDNIDLQAGCAQPLPGTSSRKRFTQRREERKGRRVISESMFKL